MKGKKFTEGKFFYVKALDACAAVRSTLEAKTRASNAHPD